MRRTAWQSSCQLPHPRPLKHQSRLHSAMLLCEQLGQEEAETHRHYHNTAMPDTHLQEENADWSWLICPRCQVRLTGGAVYFSHRPDLPSDGSTLAKKVCQWAYQQDLREGKIGPGTRSPIGCINPVYDKSTNYGPYDVPPDLPPQRPRDSL